MQERYVKVDEAVDYLEQVLGAAWLKDCLKVLKGSGGGGGGFGRAIDYVSSGVSPVAYYWYRAREEIALADITGGETTGRYSLYTAVIGDDLLVLRGSAGLEQRVAGLKEPGDAPGVVRELCIASGYARSGRKVRFTGETGLIGVEPGMRILVTETVPVKAPNQTQAKFDGWLDSGWLSGVAVAYIHTGTGTPGESGWSAGRTDLVPRSAGADGVPVVVFSMETGFMNHRPVIMRRGQMAVDGERLGEVYLPDELIMPV